MNEFEEMRRGYDLETAVLAANERRDEAVGRVAELEGLISTLRDAIVAHGWECREDLHTGLPCPLEALGV